MPRERRSMSVTLMDTKIDNTLRDTIRRRNSVLSVPPTLMPPLKIHQVRPTLVPKTNLHNELMNRFKKTDNGDITHNYAVKETPHVKLIRMRLRRKNPIACSEVDGLPSHQQQVAALLNHRDQDPKLGQAWDDPGVVLFAFDQVLDGGSVAHALQLFNDWDRYFNALITAFRNAHLSMDEKIKEDQQTRKERRQRRINYALTVVSFSLNAFGLAPITAILNAHINQFFGTTGPYSFGENPNFTGIFRTSGTHINYGFDSSGKRIQLGFLPDSAVSGIISNAVNEGLSASAQKAHSVVTEWIGGKIAAKIQDKLKAKIPSPPKSPEEFNCFLRNLQEAVIDIKDATLFEFRNILDDFRKPEICLPFTERLVLEAIEKKTFTMQDMDTIQQWMKLNVLNPTRTRLEKELKQAFECPVEGYQVDDKEIEKILWAQYFIEDKEAFVKIKSNKYEGKLELQNILGDYFVELGIAERRSNLSFFGHHRGTRRADEIEDIIHGGVVKIGKQSPGKRSLANMVRWAETYNWKKKLNKVLHVDIAATGEVSKNVAQLFDLRT